MTRVPFSEPPSTIRHEPSALCKSLSDESPARGVSRSGVSIHSIEQANGEAPHVTHSISRSQPYRCYRGEAARVGLGTPKPSRNPSGHISLYCETIKNPLDLVGCCMESAR